MTNLYVYPNLSHVTMTELKKKKKKTERERACRLRILQIKEDLLPVIDKIVSPVWLEF